MFVDIIKENVFLFGIENESVEVFTALITKSSENYNPLKIHFYDGSGYGYAGAMGFHITLFIDYGPTHFYNLCSLSDEHEEEFDFYSRENGINPELLNDYIQKSFKKFLQDEIGNDAELIKFIIRSFPNYDFA